MSKKTTQSLKLPQIAFIGTGTMGRPMAERFFNAGLDPIIHDAFKDNAKPLIERGFRWADSIADLSDAAKIVFLSLPGPTQVEAVVSDPGGLIHNLSPGSIIVDLSTNSVSMVRALAKICRERDIGFLDAPVSGGSEGSKDGTLVLMVGGEETLLEQVRPLLDILSRKIVYLGGSGSGTVAKLINNQLYLCGEVIFYEGLVLAAKADLDIEALLSILNMSGAGGIHSKVADRILDRRFDDNTFALALAEKDVALSLEAGRSLDVPMPATSAAHQLFVEAKAAGLGNKNFWSAIELVEKHASTSIKKK
jgi:3-hydroxyisobutyrate dehydrogenase-like beta-hydroxyacid dehydrogenase